VPMGSLYSRPQHESVYGLSAGSCAYGLKSSTSVEVLGSLILWMHSEMN
jgi:hypothetical protein